MIYEAPSNILPWAGFKALHSHNSTTPGGMIVFTKSHDLDILQSVPSVISELERPTKSKRSELR